jgi:hypothetical protein
VLDFRCLTNEEDFLVNLRQLDIPAEAGR